MRAGEITVSSDALLNLLRAAINSGEGALERGELSAQMVQVLTIFMRQVQFWGGGCRSVLLVFEPATVTCAAQ